MAYPVSAANSSSSRYYGQLVLFALIYGLCHYAYFQLPNQLLAELIYYQTLTRECAALINAVAPTEAVAAMQNHIVSARADLAIVRGCDGAGGFFLVLAAVLVFPAAMRRKLSGIATVFTGLYILNILRICAIYFISAYQPSWFSLVHVYLAPTLFIMTACGLFAYWAAGVAGVVHVRH